MRYQELIYIQNNNEAVRNKDSFNVNMSSDLCIFESPSFTMSGASKLHCNSLTGTTYIVTGSTDNINLRFVFTGNSESFSAYNATFKYEIYKYNSNVEVFTTPAVYKSATFTATTAAGPFLSVSDTVPVKNLKIDGEYLIKGYYNFPICTTFLSNLDKTVDTLAYRGGNQYGIYDEALDFYFIAFKKADKPQLLNNGSNTMAASRIFQQVIFPTNDQTEFTITNSYVGYVIITLNGLSLSPNLDYVISGNVVTLNAPAVSGDIITAIYTTNAGFSLTNDTLQITNPIISGSTDGQGSNKVYYNTTTGKYELYTTVTPSSIANIIVMINGLTLANNVDYYQSTTNLKRVILNGVVSIGDVVTIAYVPTTDIINGLITNTPVVSWEIATPPQANNGTFTLEVSTGNTFSILSYSGIQDYVVGKVFYYDSFVARGSVGTTLYYRVKNEKKYVTLCGIEVSSIEYSDTIPIVIQTNSINSY